MRTQTHENITHLGQVITKITTNYGNSRETGKPIIAVAFRYRWHEYKSLGAAKVALQRQAEKEERAEKRRHNHAVSTALDQYADSLGLKLYTEEHFAITDLTHRFSEAEAAMLYEQQEALETLVNAAKYLTESATEDPARSYSTMHYEGIRLLANRALRLREEIWRFMDAKVKVTTLVFGPQKEEVSK